MALRGSRGAPRPTSCRLIRALWRDRRGEDLVELVLTLPVLLIVAFGILEFGQLLDVGQGVTGLSREGANIASRGASLDSVIQITVTNGGAWDIGTSGTVVASEIIMQAGVPMIVDQRAAGPATSRIGYSGTAAAPYHGQGLVDGQTYYVVEVLVPYTAFTPLRNFVNALVPDTLYDRTLF